MNRMDPEIPTEVDIRYRAILNAVALKLTNADARLSSSLILLLISMFISA